VRLANSAPPTESTTVNAPASQTIGLSQAEKPNQNPVEASQVIGPTTAPLPDVGKLGLNHYVTDPSQKAPLGSVTVNLAPSQQPQALAKWLPDQTQLTNKLRHLITAYYSLAPADTVASREQKLVKIVPDDLRPALFSQLPITDTVYNQLRQSGELAGNQSTFEPDVDLRPVTFVAEANIAGLRAESEKDYQTNIITPVTIKVISHNDKLWFSFIVACTTNWQYEDSTWVLTQMQP
jgi:hypothetical protein